MRKGIHHLRCAVGSKVSIKQKWHANEQKPARNPGTDAASIISASRKWFSLPGSCPEDNNWPRERESARRTYGAGYYPTDAPGAASRRTAKACSWNYSGNLRWRDTWRGTLVSESLTPGQKTGIARRYKYGCAECALKRDAAANDSFVRSPATRISIVFQIEKRSVLLPREVSVRASIAL